MVESISLAAVVSSTTGTGTAGAGVSSRSVEAFGRSLERHLPEQAMSGQVPAGSAPPAASTVQPADATNAQTRARRALDLDGASQAADAKGQGDVILQGLQKLRGVFDRREATVSDLMSRSAVDARTMMAMQMEVANFTLMVDVASKLTGKSTQAFDTLMKGQ